MTALDYAAKYGDTAAIEALLKAGADVKAVHKVRLYIYLYESI